MAKQRYRSIEVSDLKLMPMLEIENRQLVGGDDATPVRSPTKKLSKSPSKFKRITIGQLNSQKSLLSLGTKKEVKPTIPYQKKRYDAGKIGPGMYHADYTKVIKSP